jgi:hypothetical protein
MAENIEGIRRRPTALVRVQCGQRPSGLTIAKVCAGFRSWFDPCGVYNLLVFQGLSTVHCRLTMLLILISAIFQERHQGGRASPR